MDSADDDSVRVLFGGPSGLTAARAFGAGRLPYYRLGAGDVVGDRAAELLAPAQRDDAITILGGAGAGQLAPAATPVALGAKPWVVRSADVDGDGRRDLVVVLVDGIAVMRGVGDGRFEGVPGSPFPVPAAGIATTGDLDGDGIADIAVGSWNGAGVTVLAGGTFARRDVLVGDQSIGLTICDLDGDGRNELVAASATDNVVIVMRPYP